jgi:DNA-directed RNA polymerase specialized sigma24 family protein
MPVSLFFPPRAERGAIFNPTKASALLNGVRDGEPSAAADLYRELRWVKCSVQPYARADSEDLFHETYLAVLHGIRNGTLREPTKLPAYALCTAHHLVVRRFRKGQHLLEQLGGDGENTPFESTDCSPEDQVYGNEVRTIAARVLLALRRPEREVVVRSVMYEQPTDHVCREMKLTLTQLRLLKWRAKARLLERSRRCLLRERIAASEEE